MENYAYGFQQYKEQSVSTMTQGEMLILLYDELLKRLTRAEFSIKSLNYQVFDESVQRSCDIIKYLSSTLDKKYPISKDILRLYEFIGYELSRLKASRKVEIINEIKPLVQQFRDSFKEADKVCKQKQ